GRVDDGRRRHAPGAEPRGETPWLPARGGSSAYPGHHHLPERGRYPLSELPDRCLLLAGKFPRGQTGGKKGRTGERRDTHDPGPEREGAQARLDCGRPAASSGAHAIEADELAHPGERVHRGRGRTPT